MSLQQIEDRYNPEYDVPPNGPPVTWAEYDLLLAFKVQEKRLYKLEKEKKLLLTLIEALENRIIKLEENK